MAQGRDLTPTRRPPTYRERLRLEGGVLAAVGLIGSVVLLVAVDEATQRPSSTIVQLGIVAGLLAILGPMATNGAMKDARRVAPEDAGSGEPTPLWQLPLIVAALALPFGFGVGWDAGLRVTGGCLLVGLAQAVLLERTVAAREQDGEGRFIRLPGSRIVQGTLLGRLPPER